MNRHIQVTLMFVATLLIVSPSIRADRSRLVAYREGQDVESPSTENGSGTSVARLQAAIEATSDGEQRGALVSQLAQLPGAASLRLAIDLMQNDPAQCEIAARVAAQIGAALAQDNRDVVRAAMQQVIATSRVPETVRLADIALREAARSVNLAQQASASSPDGLEPDGGSGSDSAAIDGNPTTYWDEIDNQPLYRFKLSFPKPTHLNTVVIRGHAYESHSPKDFDVLCDNEVVAQVQDAQYDRQTNELQIDVDRRECSTFELKITGYYGGSPGIRELEIYDIDTHAPRSALAPLPDGPPQFSWQEERDALALLNYSRIVWKLNYRDVAKPYFDPIGLIDGASLVWNSPPDHPWHHGLWFAWKGINGVNYWEEDGNSGRSEGLTDVVSVTARPAADFAAQMDMTIQYHPADQAVVLQEQRKLAISAPDKDGNYSIDWRSTFRAMDQDVLLEGGTAGGGYAGLSVRTAAATRDWRLTNSEGKAAAPAADPLPAGLHGQHARWMDFSLVHAGNGRAAGVTIFEHPASLRHPTQWHCVLEDKIPFGYFSPSPLWSEPYTLKAGSQFTLAYRILIHPERLSPAELENRWQDFAADGR